MKRINKKDYVEFMKQCENLVLKNLQVLEQVNGETMDTIICQSDVVGKMFFHFDKYDYKYNNKVYYICVRFEELERAREAFGAGYYNANIGYSGKMIFAAFEDQEEKERMASRFYDLICSVTETEVIE